MPPARNLAKRFFISGNGEKDNLEPLVTLINDAETYCNPDTRFRLTEKGKQKVKALRNTE